MKKKLAVRDLDLWNEVYTLFTVLKCNLVVVFRCFLHYTQNDITSQTKNKIHNHTQTAALRRPPI
jgi:hypothetical protein